MLNQDSELVLGIISPVGTNVSIVIQSIINQLKRFNYSTDVISVSSDVLCQFTPSTMQFYCEYDRICYYMGLGNDIRKLTNDSSFLMKGVATEIYKKRETKNKAASSRPRTAYIIKSIKHPDEVAFLRDAYGDGFHLIGISSSIERRRHYLMEQQLMSSKQAQEILDRDIDEKVGHGQHTRDAFQLSDYFRDISDSILQIENATSRLIDLLFGEPFITPCFEEYAMFMAYASSLRSADLSRQIGAVITRNNEILSSGVNDCPQFGGGLYWSSIDPDGNYVDTSGGRDYTNKFDPNKIEQKKIYDKIYGTLDKVDIPDREEIYKEIQSCGINDLTEYGRVVHGEMEAILMCARNNISCQDAILYATTFPCHNCAKHIIAAGIKEVVYIEPYPKSKAFDFYKAEITDNIQERGKKVLFRPFVGVGPHRFIDLFAVNSIRWYTRKRKDSNGNKLEWNRSNANLRNPMNILSYIDYEKSAVLDYESSLVKYFQKEGEPSWKLRRKSKGRLRVKK